MKTLTLATLAAVSCLAAPARAAQDAQMDFTPAEEMASFDVMLGHWKGGGNVVMVAGAEAMPWTGESTVRKILGGHFVVEELTVDMGGGMPPFEMLSTYGWDGENGRYVQFSSSSMGGGSHGELFWPKPGTLVGANTVEEMGQIHMDRSITRFDEDGYTFRIDRSTDAGEFYTHVDGKFRRTAAGATAGEAAARTAALADALIQMKPMLGTWDVRGWMVPAPGAEKMQFEGREVITSGLAGNVLLSRVTGEATGGMQYEAFGMIYRDARTGAYVFTWVDSMGQSGTLDGRLEGENDVVLTSAGLAMGQPFVERGIMTFGDDTMKFVSDRYTGTGPGVRVFETAYARAK